MSGRNKTEKEYALTNQCIVVGEIHKCAGVLKLVYINDQIYLCYYERNRGWSGDVKLEGSPLVTN